MHRCATEVSCQDAGLSLLFIFRGGGRMADCAAGVDVILAAGTPSVQLLCDCSACCLQGQECKGLVLRADDDLSLPGACHKLWPTPQDFYGNLYCHIMSKTHEVALLLCRLSSGRRA